MKVRANWIKKILYKNLSLNTYITLLSKLYFVSFRSGLLKGDKSYEYPYFLRNIIKEGDICLDIGANLGYYTLELSKLTGKKGKVYAVEPIKPILKVLRNNTRYANNIEILPFALGEVNKSIQLGNDTVHKSGFMRSGSHSIIDKESDYDVKFEAEMKMGSEVFSHLNKLDFIKCDIEGYEVIVLSELEQIIKKFRPILLIETRNKNRKTLIQFFQEHNFNNYILDEGKLIPATDKQFWDMLTIPEEKEESLKAFITKADINNEDVSLTPNTAFAIKDK